LSGTGSKHFHCQVYILNRTTFSTLFVVLLNSGRVTSRLEWTGFLALSCRLQGWLALLWGHTWTHGKIQCKISTWCLHWSA